MTSFERTGNKDVALLIVRMAGLYLAFGHGWGKFYALVTGNGGWIVEMVAGLGFPMPTLFAWSLGITEFVGGLCLALGLGARLFGALVAFAMTVAAFLQHNALLQLAAWIGLASPSEERLQSLGSPERAILFLLVGLAVAIAGPGRLSVDRVLRERGR